MRRGRVAVALAISAGVVATACIKREAPVGGTAAPEQAAAATPEGAPLPPSLALVGEAGIEAFALQGKAELAEVKPISVEGQPFERALEAKVKDLGESEWAVQVQAGTVGPVEKDDVLLATFYARVETPLEGGGGQTGFVFERAGAPYTKSVTYPVWLSPEWRKIQVRFVASESYPSGGANVIFRLGYAPETIQIGGLSVENFQKKVALNQLPDTQVADRSFAQASVVAKPLEAQEAGDLLFDIKPAEVIRKISPYVYGLNSQEIESSGASVRRNGGNRGSVYNWEINASNAGKDWHHTSDDWPCTVLGIKNCGEPAAQFTGFFEQNKKAGAATVVTVPMLDYAAADKAGDVKLEQKPPSPRFVKASPKKNGALAATPDLKDGAVYQDEFVNFLVSKLGKAKDGGVNFYSLDNEPALWSETHPLVHPDRTTYSEVVKRSEETAKVITDIDPSAFVLGGVMFGWAEYQSLSSAPDAGEYKEYPNYLEYFLAALKKLEQKHHRRLVHALDVHWYPEARGSARITLEDASHATIDARLQAPRSLWDPTYSERSWIVQQTGKPIRLIPWLRETVQKRYPGTDLAMTEYNFGATTHISGALAQVDVLGVLGREGVYLANYWGKGAGVGKLPPYIASAFQMYRNYDGKGGQFGDTAVKASVTEDELGSVFAATDSKQPNVLTIIAINKTQQKRFDGVFRIGSAGQYSKVEAYSISPAATGIKPGQSAKLEGNVVRYKLEPLSATLLVLKKGSP